MTLPNKDIEALQAAVSGPVGTPDAARARLDRVVRGIIRRAAQKALRDTAAEVEELIKLSPANDLALRKISPAHDLELGVAAAWADVA